MNTVERIGSVLGYITLFLILVGLTWWSWNNIAPFLFGWPALSFRQATALHLLVGLTMRQLAKVRKG